MARDFFINGETMVSVKGRAGSGIDNLTQLCLTDGPVRVQLDLRHRPITADAWGNEVPVDVQWMLGMAVISMTGVHIDRDVLDDCIQESMGGRATIGLMERAGARLGNNVATLANGNKFIRLNLASPVENKPWRFRHTYLASTVEIPLGTDRSMFGMTWIAIPYTQDPWGGGTGARDFALWDHTADV